MGYGRAMLIVLGYRHRAGGIWIGVGLPEEMDQSRHDEPSNLVVCEVLSLACMAFRSG